MRNTSSLITRPSTSQWRQTLLLTVLLALLLAVGGRAQAQTTSGVIGSTAAFSSLNELYQFTPYSFSDAKVHILFTAADLTAAGIPFKATISGLDRGQIWYSKGYPVSFQAFPRPWFIIPALLHFPLFDPRGAAGARYRFSVPGSV